MNLDSVPGGVANGTDNLIFANPVTPGTFEHPTCDEDADGIIVDLPTSFPIGSE